MFKEYFLGILRDRYVLWSLINCDLRLKYRRSKLGVLWSILTPLGLSIIIGGVYSILFEADVRTFIPALFAGLNPWIFISSSADSGSMAFIGAEGYIKQTNVSAQIFPLRVVLVNFINLLYALLAFLAVYLFLQPDMFGPIMLMTIPGLIVMFIFSLSLANLASCINLVVRDYQPLQNLVFQGLFYATPIIFEASMLMEKGAGIVYQVNPFYYILEIVKIPIRGMPLPEPSVYIVAILITAILFVAGVVAVMKTKKGIALKL